LTLLCDREWLTPSGDEIAGSYDVVVGTDNKESADSAITLGFYGTASNGMSVPARAFEDEVLALLPDHGAKTLFRGHRQAGESEELPVEFHVLWFPSSEALDAYLKDPRRAEILARYGEVFTAKVVVRLEQIQY
jgi:uncharacterized protein (DUF1330 family)